MIETSRSLKNSVAQTRAGWREHEKEKGEMNVNCQFYEMRVAKVSCYHYRRQRCCLSTSRVDHEKSARR